MGRFRAVQRKARANPHRYNTACRLCEDRHPLRLCPIYRSKIAEQRLREVIIANLCGNCLSMDHQTDQCTSEGRCRLCGKNHHTTLHLDEVKAKNREPAENVGKPLSVQIEEKELLDDCVISLFASESEAETGSLRPEKTPNQSAQGGTETRALRSIEERKIYRPLLQHERGTETRALRSIVKRQRPQKHKQINRHQDTNMSTLRPRGYQNNNRLVPVQDQPRRSNKFRSGLPTTVNQCFQPTTAITPTAVVKVEASRCLHLVRALVDACEPTSLISADLAHDLGLTQSPEGSKRGCIL